MEKSTLFSLKLSVELSVFIIICFFGGLSLQAAEVNSARSNGSVSKLIFINARLLDEVKHSIGKKEYTEIAAILKKAAEKALKIEPVSVMEKTQVPPSGDKHDYMSLAKYWFPDPSKTDGKPYIRKDGEVNPESKNFPDHDNLSVLIRTVNTLSIAYYVFEDQRYAEHAAKLIKVWFLEPETKMNPNLEFAQAVPGRNEGRGAGIVDAHRLPRLCDAIYLLQSSKSWTDTDNEQMKAWFGNYLKWLLESKNGKSEASAKNNHGSWYEVQVASIAFFLGKEELTKEILIQRTMERISRQIQTDGQQPEELVRTKSLHYSMFNIEALFHLAVIGDKLGVDLWNYKSTDGRGIQAALAYLLPFLNGEKVWEHKQITEIKPGEFYGIMRLASAKYPEDELIRIYMEKYSKEKLYDLSNIIY